MSVGSGIGAQLGVSPEVTYGTYVAPARFIAGTKFEIKPKLNTAPIMGIAAGRPAPPDEVVTTTAGEGKVEMEVLKKGFGLLLQHIFGGTITPVQQAATTAYLQTHPWADNRGKSLTAQLGLPTRAGVANPYTGLGGKVTQAEFSCSVDDLLKCSLDLDFQSVTEAQGLAAASYTTPNLPFHFGQMKLKLGTFGAEASVQGVRGVTCTITRGQDTEGFYAGNAGLKSEPIWNEFVEVSGSIDIDNVNKADFLDRFAGHTATSMVWEFVGANIASTYDERFAITCPKVYFGGDIPGVEGPDVIKGAIPFKAFFDVTNGIVSASLMSTDVTN